MFPPVSLSTSRVSKGLNLSKVLNNTYHHHHLEKKKFFSLISFSNYYYIMSLCTYTAFFHANHYVELKVKKKEREYGCNKTREREREKTLQRFFSRIMCVLAVERERERASRIY